MSGMDQQCTGRRMVVVGRLAQRRFLYVLALLRTEGIDVSPELVSAGLLDRHYTLTTVGTREQIDRVEDVLRRMMAG